MPFSILSRLISAVLVLLAVAAPRDAAAQRGISFVRDAEAESIIRRFATPIFNAAGLDADAVRIYLVNDPRLNAFVAGGQNLFLHTGTLMRSDSPNQLIGVIAHETGHIAGGHLARTQEALRNATLQSMVAMVLGGLAGAATGQGNVAGAVIYGAGAMAQRTVLSYSVAQESAADQAGMGFLDRTGQSARGLFEFFRILQGQDLLSPERQDPYLRTHPLTRQRMDVVEQHLSHSKLADAKDSPEFVELHARMKAKLAGFLDPPSSTLSRIKESDKSVASRYARAVAYYRIPDLGHALPLVDGLIAEEPKNPYFRELKGQMLFENGRLKEALEPYEEAVRLAPDQPLLRIDLAQVQLESGDPGVLKKAMANLNEAIRVEDKNAKAWRLLAIAYGRDNNIGMAALALAEQGLAQGDKRQAIQQATRATQLLPPGPSRTRADDIRETARRIEERDRE